MSGKFEKKDNQKRKKNTKRKKTYKALWIGIAVSALLLCLVIGVLLAQSRSNANELPPEAESENATTEATVVQTTATEEPEYIYLGEKVILSEIGSYNGVYMEDGSDEIVSNILKIKVTNTNDKGLQYAEITLNTENGPASFSVSTLAPGESVVLLEKNRMQYDNQVTYTDARMELASFFEEPVSLYEDILQIQTLNDAMNVTNISDKNITGKIIIYYKNWSNGIYYGGITYRVTIDDGLSAGEVRQIMGNHFRKDASKIVMVTYNET